jgi:hypothetical protein
MLLSFLDRHADRLIPSSIFGRGVLPSTSLHVLSFRLRYLSVFSKPIWPRPFQVHCILLPTQNSGSCLSILCIFHRFFSQYLLFYPEWGAVSAFETLVAIYHSRCCCLDSIYGREKRYVYSIVLVRGRDKAFRSVVSYSTHFL